ncbi:class I SAM-dependent methyltransferase [Kitasatospora sp. NBC_01250]|uniref:class I SAM-dependent methyltransferase n=1 Tax=Kitasatospora sp. NBC_01250 TaxID=2903571 RepID=UPI002E359CFC|nr:class I SAM-dependent methyltransferase [Kitasatospora sp. NBC_01250]
MSTEEHVQDPRALVFGQAAEEYDAGRSGYAAELVDEVLGYAALDGLTALEAGAGTGKASVLFAERDVPLVCVEPDPQMAEVLRRNTAGHPRVSVEVSGFEQWQPGDRRFGLFLAATCWHWFDPARRWDLVHAALAPGGAVALLWNPHGVLDPDLHAELGEIDRRYEVASSPHAALAADYGDQAGYWADGDEDPSGWPEAECRQDGRFTDLRSLRHGVQVQYDTERYLSMLASISSYRVLPAEQRERALAETGRLLDARGGGIGMLHLTDLFLARRR